MIRTLLCERMGIQYPIIQGGMGPYSTNRLCVAVANAGALGIISGIGMATHMSSATPVDPRRVFGTGTPKEIMRRSIAEVTKDTTDSGGIYGVNVPVSVEFLQAARALIEETLACRERDPEVGARLRAIITSAGDPVPWRDLIKGSGVTWFHVVPSAYHARRAEKAGVDMIIASGHEGGAHVAWEPVHSMVLIPEVVRHVVVPVIAAGGICDGVTLAAALALGAEGVQMGTRFIATRESDFHPTWKKGILDRDERKTLVARGFFGPMRFLRNSQAEAIVEATLQRIGGFYLGQPLDSTREILELEKEGFEKLLEGEGDCALMLAGEVSGRIGDLPKVPELIQRIVQEAEETISKLVKHIS
jgi:enoyl-[acyl-carrier protein] reductase II